MPINKVIYEGQVLIDITDSTISAGDIRTGLVAYDKGGNRIVGNTDYTLNVTAGASVSQISGRTSEYLLTLTSA